MTIWVGVCAFKRKYYTSQHIRVVEIQRTFYNIPRKETVMKWRSEAPEDFIFNLKAFQGLTHTTSSPTWRRFSHKITDEIRKYAGNLRVNPLTRSWLETQIEYARLLNARFIIIQTPAKFRPTPQNIENSYKFFETLEEILDQKSADFFVGWEPRGDWLKNPAPLREIVEHFDFLVHVSDPFYHRPAVEKEIGYFRLHGKPYLNYKYRYTQNDFSELIDFLERYQFREVFIMFNNTYMETNAKEFLEFLRRRK